MAEAAWEGKGWFRHAFFSLINYQGIQGWDLEAENEAEVTGNIASILSTHGFLFYFLTQPAWGYDLAHSYLDPPT